MKILKKIFNKRFIPNIENYNPTKFIFLTFLFSICVALLDGVIYYFFFMEEKSFLGALFFHVSLFDIYIRIMIIITFTIFGSLTAIFINKIKTHKEQLAESELKFKTFVTHSKDWIYWIAPDKSFYFISPSCKEITGYSTEEFANNIDLLNRIIYNEDRELFIEHENNSLRGENLDELEFRIVTKNNEIKWIHHLCQSIYSGDGKYVGHCVSNRDITKLKETQNELAKLSNQLQNTNRTLEELVDQRTMEMKTFMIQCPYPRAIYDNKGNLVSCNPAWDNTFNSYSDKKTIYNNLLIKNSKLEDKVKKVFQTGERFKSYPVYIEEIDKMLIFDFYSIKNKKNEIEKIVCNIEDITEQARSEELTQELETRKDLVGEIFDFLDAERKHISKELHDRIGQNLMLIKMNAEMQQESNSTDITKINEIIELTRKTSKEIKEIIYSLYPEEIEKYGLTESIQNMINRVSKLSKIKFEVKFFGKNIGLNKRYELAIFRVSQEALNNITKHSNATEACFEYHFKHDMIFGKISDNGAGFDLNKNGKVSSESKYGLKFIRERIESIEGQLELYSEINKGTTIYFEIPLSEQHNEEN